MSSHDCLLWIGSSYTSVEQYLSEAEERGCCRKIPSWFSWLRKGRTRVFLAHHDRFDSSDKGVIFGYFILDGIGVVLTQTDYEKYNKLLTRLVDKITKIDNNKTIDTLREYLKSPTGIQHAEPFLKFWRKLVPYDPLPFKLGKVKTVHDNKLYDHFIDFLVDFFLSCDEPNFNIESTGYGISTDQTHIEPPRKCLGGQRVGPNRTGRPTFYAVDSFSRKIDDEFCKQIKDRIKECLKRKKNKKDCLYDMRNVATSINKNERTKISPEFKAALNAATKSMIDLKIPDELKSCSHIRGRVIVFNNPYPAFKKTPKASFKGVIQVDGNDLLEQIIDSYKHDSSHKTPLSIPYYTTHNNAHGNSITKDEIISAMSQDLRTSKNLSRYALNWLTEETLKELSKHGIFRWPGVGTLRVINKKGKRVLKFTPSNRTQKIVATQKDE